MTNSFSGWGSGFVGVLIFSGSLPATRVAVGSLDPMFLTSVRAVLAALLGGAILLVLRQSKPDRADLPSLIIVAAGVVIGFPLLTASALQHITAAHSVVFIGLLPLATGAFGVLRGDKRPRPLFWLFSVLGSLAVVGFALNQNADVSLLGDALMLAAVVVCGLGYAEGAMLSRRLGGWQVICWALVLALPLMAALALVFRPETLSGLPVTVWISVGYVSMFSMLIGFFFWYRGLALGGTAGVGQLQLLQPFFGLILSALLLSEPTPPLMIAVTVFVVLCVAGAKRYA
ncbi:MAG: DMT family transporter [Roseibium album]|uniref:EamA family transporter n=1 Tax=Roseibium album TaxID=311410 RepID=UPI000D5586DA|nr:drug/metabolite transporter (DMT)-like permease [Labrenzia sp. EL_162]MBG6164887.1 drug/metabolite transporter (DMT)-like permease [Labrenzia sp. EL_195]MBG6173422.1 drug/metabolite transporter (DMT)-like permease [Labrenzia sp. EL_132]MBG6195505.1 drug/metabolite transporter (DMT)-like permease [Labrenzia sp. EL_159]MBG6227808.1 drug/metabolite transporter (DMT)-like permease [Labrenzia sp. EL_208]